MTLAEELDAIAALLGSTAQAVSGVLAAEPAPGERRYLCAFGADDGARTWLVVDAAGAPILDRASVRDTVAVSALCELAADHAFPGDLDELRAQLVQLRITEAPEGIEEAEAAALDLQHVIGVPPQLATPARLDEIGAATRRLELALDPGVPSPFAAAMQAAQAAVEELVAEIESAYTGRLDGTAAG